MDPSACRNRFRAALRQHRRSGSGGLTACAVNAGLHLDHLLLQRISLGSVPILPQDCRKIAHRGQAVGVLLTQLAAADGDDAFKQFASLGKIALRRDRPGQIVQRPQCLEIGIAEQTAPPVHDLLLQAPRLGQITLGGERNGQLADCLQGLCIPITQLAAASFDDLFLELVCRNQPALPPVAVGEVEHGGKRIGVVLAEHKTPLRY